VISYVGFAIGRDTVVKAPQTRRKFALVIPPCTLILTQEPDYEAFSIGYPQGLSRAVNVVRHAGL